MLRNARSGKASFSKGAQNKMANPTDARPLRASAASRVGVSGALAGAQQWRAAGAKRSNARSGAKTCVNKKSNIIFGLI
jgi:hypothetical protein